MACASVYFVWIIAGGKDGKKIIAY